MAARGQKPKPTALKIVEGVRGHRPLPQYEAEVEPGIPAPPDFLNGDAKKEWSRMSKILFEVGLLANIDMATFAAYCQAYGRWAEAERILATTGYIEHTSNGNIVQHPMVGTANTAMRDAVKFAVEFGLTPSARSRVVATPPVRGNGKGKTKYY